MNYLLSDTSFWAFVGLILFFVVIIFVGAPKMIGKALDDRQFFCEQLIVQQF